MDEVGPLVIIGEGGCHLTDDRCDVLTRRLGGNDVTHCRETCSLLVEQFPPFAGEGQRFCQGQGFAQVGQSRGSITGVAIQECLHPQPGETIALIRSELRVEVLCFGLRAGTSTSPQ